MKELPLWMGLAFCVFLLFYVFWPRKQEEEPPEPKTLKEELLSRKWQRPIAWIELASGDYLAATHCVCGRLHKDDEELLLCVHQDGLMLVHKSCVIHEPR